MKTGDWLVQVTQITPLRLNLCLFSAYLGTRSLKTFWSLVILILNYLNFSFWSVAYVKLQVISSFTFKCYWLEIRSVT